MGRKIVFIGAGSVVFTLGLLADMIRKFDGQKWKLALVDIDPKALDISKKLCEKMIRYKNSDIELSSSIDRCDCLPGSDYVVTMIGVGGRRAWEQDVFIPRKYGVFQPGGDTVMPGGISRAMRMIPALIDIVKDILRLCPSAKYFNFTNPMAIACRALQKAAGIPAAGLCDGVPYTQDYLADFAGVDRKRFSSYAVGLNHLSFIFDFRIDGQDAARVFQDRLRRLRVQGVDYTDAGQRFAKNEKHELFIEAPFSWELFETLGAFPAAGEMHVVEFYAERFSGYKCYYGKTLGLDAFSFEEMISRGEKRFADMQKLAESPDELPEGYFDSLFSEHEKLMSIIEAMELDSRAVFSANVPNNGAVRNLPYNAVLEMPAAATGKGLLPLQINDFPDTTAAITARHAAIVELAAEAALKGSRELFAEAVLMGGYLNDRKTVMNLVDEMIKAHAQYLPQFSS